MGSIIGLVASYEMRHFGKTINHHQNGVFVALGAWETKYEAHTHVQPWSLWCRQGSVEPLRECMALGRLANRAPLDQVFNVFKHVWPKAVLFSHNVGLVFPKMTGKRPSMDLPKYKLSGATLRHT